MFSFGRHKKQLDVQALLRRAIDASSPNLPRAEGEHRWDSRANRTFPLVLAAWEDGEVNVAGATTALTKNLSSQGLTAVLYEPLQATQLVVGFWLESQAYFVLGEVRHRTPLGGGYWQLGIELGNLLTPGEHPALEQLLPMVAGLMAADHHPV
ncbi:MAG TPA: hypothetical protein VG056_11115 [Pirellulales bacterium]|jgi:hypothetical protein|nr:hypothetical protein [Pirellulales bacterium]